MGRDGERIDPKARIVTDELNAYPRAVKGVAGWATRSG